MPLISSGLLDGHQAVCFSIIRSRLTAGTLAPRLALAQAGRMLSARRSAPMFGTRR